MCSSFGDVGCDHGYCTKYMLDRGLCDTAYVSDISQKSLKKAEILLFSYMQEGRCLSICCDGLSGYTSLPEEVLIAGMGGEQIIKMLKGAIPQKFVLQPMKNEQKVRRFLIDSGCRITYDGIFKDDKYYFLIKGTKQGPAYLYTDMETEFGRDSLKSPLFLCYIDEEIEKFTKRLSLATTALSKTILEKKIAHFKEVKDVCKRRIKSS